MDIHNPVVMTGTIISNREVAAGRYLLSCRLPAAFPDPAPGQFIMVKANDGIAPLLRRPFSVYNFERGEPDSTLDIIYQLVGPGTKLLATLLSGATISVMGPLGRGFTMIPERKNIIIIAGGIGLAPLSWLVTRYCALLHNQETAAGKPTRRIMCYIGAATSDSLVGIERIEACCREVKVCTDDGSCGYRGNVIELFRRDRAFFNPDDAAIYACGPLGMLKNLAELLAGEDLFCQVSLEERMACGLGACLGCAVAVKDREESRPYQRVCTDGPVFNLQEVDWHA